MPWQLNGTFVRVNTDFSGPTVWQQDQSAAIKIIASRHDTHDQDLATGIEQCLNLDGFNTMRAPLNMGGRPITDLGTGFAETDAATIAQVVALQNLITANTEAIAAIETTNPDNIIDSMSWNGSVLNAQRVSGNFTVDFKLFNTFKSGGVIRHKAAVIPYATAVTIDSLNMTRFHLTNSGNIALTINKPIGADAELGETYEIEGSIIITNTGAPGSITLVGVTGDKVIGAPLTNPNVQYTLSYLIIRTATDYKEQYVWSTP